ncbi:MAG: hypothetical protein IPK82_24295 [Polyangiaceae bacterium]|nr:hypothetical protein [Polyangiaceae bacterium]
MASLAHDVLVQALRDDLKLLPALLWRLRKKRLAGRLQPLDSAVRLTHPVEIRPDVVYQTRGGWLVVEVQNKVDPTKRRSWFGAVTALRVAHALMGDIVVITASRAVARWAAKVAVETGLIGTTIRLTPVVVYLGLKQAQTLLDPAFPELGLCAAWAMKHRHGRTAARVVERAIDLADRLPKPLRKVQWRAIFNVLGEKMRFRLREASMHPDRVPESPATRKLRLFLEANAEKRGRAEGEAKGRAEGEAHGERVALRIVLDQRGLNPTAAQLATINSCSDPKLLKLWLERSVAASSVAEVLALPTNKKVAAVRSVTRRAPPRRVRKTTG